MMSAYRMTQAVKIKEMRDGCDEEGSSKKYQSIAASILLEYGYKDSAGNQ
jgi:hypothetical protein